MIKIGLIGEDPNDTQSIANLLSKKLDKGVQFIIMLKKIRGGHLDARDFSKAIRIEYEDRNPDFVLFIRDADAIITENKKIDLRLSWFKNLLPQVDNKGFLLLNIYELEALILADIATFNDIYKVNLNYKSNVLYQTDPKEFLKLKTAKNKNKFEESACPMIFSKLNFENVYNNCITFRRFYNYFESIIVLCYLLKLSKSK